MLRGERASVRPGTAAAFLDLSATGPTSLPPLYVSHISQKYLPTCSPIARFTASCGYPSAQLRIRCRNHLPARASSCVVRFSLLPVAHPTRASRSLLLRVPPDARPLARVRSLRRRACARLCSCWWCRRVPQVGPSRAKGTHERCDRTVQFI
jgi:hypothetical protein